MKSVVLVKQISHRIPEIAATTMIMMGQMENGLAYPAKEMLPTSVACIATLTLSSSSRIQFRYRRVYMRRFARLGLHMAEQRLLRAKLESRPEALAENFGSGHWVEVNRD